MKKCANCGAVTLDTMTVCLECGTLFEQAPPKKATVDHQEDEQLDFDQLEFVEAEVLAPNKEVKANSPQSRKKPKVTEAPIAPTAPLSELDIEAETEISEPSEPEQKVGQAAFPETETPSEPFIPPIAPANSVNLMREVFNPEPHYVAPNTFGPSEHEPHQDVIDEILSTVDCPHCGNENPSYYSFCHFCKHRLHDYTAEEQVGNTRLDAEAARSEAILSAKSNLTPPSGSGADSSSNEESDEFVLSHLEVETPVVTKQKSHRPKEPKPKKESNFFKWIVRLLIAAILIALAVLAFLYLRSNNNAEAVYTTYRQAIIDNDYAKAAELTANHTGPAWQAADVEKMLANYSQAEIDLVAMLNEQQEGTALESGSTSLMEIETEPSFLGLMNDYEVVVQPISLALTVPNNYRDIKLTTFAHADQSITAGDPIIIEPRETAIIVSLHDGSEQRYVELNLDYSLLEGGTLPISLKQVNNQIQIDEASLGIQYPNQFQTTGFVIDGETYNSSGLTLNGYVSQSFTVAILADYFGEAVQSDAVEIRLVDAEEVVVDLSDDATLPNALAEIELENADNIQPSQDSDQFDQWVQEFQETFIDAVNFRAPDLLAVYGDTSQWYQDTAQWIQNDIATTSIFYTDATYDITSIEETDDGNVAISTLERYYYTLDGIEAVRSLNKVYRLQSISGQYVIASVDEQDTSN